MRRRYRHTIVVLAGWLLLTGLSVLAMWLVATLSLSRLAYERLPTALASKLSADYSAGGGSLAPLDPGILAAINRDRLPPALTSGSGPALVPIFIAGRGNVAPAGPTASATAAPAPSLTPTPAAPWPTSTAPVAASPSVPAPTAKPKSAATPQGGGGPPATPAAGGQPATATPPPAATPAPAPTLTGPAATPPPAPQPSPAGGPSPGHGRP